MSAQYEHLLIETTPAGVCTIMLNRPARLNAVNSRMAIELPLAIEEAAADKSVRVIVITGAGRGFCAGLDLDPANVAEQRAMNQTEDDLGWVGRWVLAVTNCPKPVIAAINGPAAGAGLGLALAAD
ncbi:MAG TPA: enoyl-CoA hydratase-related protein, partial [Ktedonobacteraceae bacterium]|nr:enoyl-CoA hydratase-related protein [Ktedonobacteraceae bacterium]